jgi:hypothetical protein
MKPQERLDSGPTTNSVPIDIGKTAAEGAAAGQRTNEEFNRQLNEQFTDKRPPYEGTSGNTF